MTDQLLQTDNDDDDDDNDYDDDDDDDDDASRCSAHMEMFHALLPCALEKSKGG